MSFQSPRFDLYQFKVFFYLNNLHRVYKTLIFATLKVKINAK